MKKILFLVLALNSLFGLDISGFQTEVYTKQNGLKKIEMTLDVVLRDPSVNKSALYDALNVIVGSFYAEDLMTSMGKENFKQNFIKYAAKKHNIDIDEVYIINLKFVNEIDIEKIIKAIKERDLCKTQDFGTSEFKRELDVNKNVGDFGEN